MRQASHIFAFLMSYGVYGLLLTGLVAFMSI